MPPPPNEAATGAGEGGRRLLERIWALFDFRVGLHSVADFADSFRAYAHLEVA